MSAQIYSTNLKLPINFQNKVDSLDTPIKAEDLNHLGKMLEAQQSTALLALGYGVAPSVGGGLVVTAGAGLSVDIASGLAIVGQSGFALGAQITSTYNVAPLPASRDNSNPIYLFVKAGDGTGGSPQTIETRQAIFQVSNLSSIPGAVLLAKITTSSSAVLTVTDMRQFIEVGGDSLPNGGTTGQVLAKASGTDGDANWITPAGDTATAQNQKFTLNYSGPGPVQFTRNGYLASFNPGDAVATEKTALVPLWADLGVATTDLSIVGGTSTAATPAGFNFSGSSTTASNGLYVNDGGPLVGGVQRVVLSGNSNYYVESDGTVYKQKYSTGGPAAIIGTGPSGNTLVGTWTAPSGTPPTVMSQAAVAGTVTQDIEVLGGKYLPKLTVVSDNTTFPITQDANLAGAPSSISSLAELRGRVKDPDGAGFTRLNLPSTTTYNAGAGYVNGNTEIIGLTANLTYIVPNEVHSNYFKNSSSTYTITVKTAAGVGVVIPPNTTLHLDCDGVNVVWPINIVVSPDGTRYKIGVADGGALNTTAL